MYLVEEPLNVGFERGAGLDDEFLSEHERVLALRLLWLHDVDEDDVEQLIGDEVGLGDEGREHVQHEALHLARVLVAEKKEIGNKVGCVTTSLTRGLGHMDCTSLFFPIQLFSRSINLQKVLRV